MAEDGASQQPGAESAIAIGSKVLGRYIVDRYLSEGGMGQVFLGHHEYLGTVVALKVLFAHATETLKARFVREAQLMAKIRHPNVVSVLDFGFLDNGWPCIAMEFLEGEELADRLERDGPMPWPRAIDLFLGVLIGLDAVHQEGIMHRDLKPANVIVVPAKEREICKLIDFGIARVEDGDSTRYTQTGHAVGTPAYMAPEQLLGAEIDKRADIYAASIVLYEMLSGTLPYGKDMTSMLKRLTEPPRPPRSPAIMPVVRPELQQLILEGMAIDPKRRIQSANEFVDRLVEIRRMAVTANATARRAHHEHVSPERLARMQEAAKLRAPAERTMTGPAQVLPPPPPQAPRAQAPRVAPPAPEPAMEETYDVAVSQSSPERGNPTAYKFVFGAAIPPSRLSIRAERGWLASLVRGLGRGFTLGASFWFVVLPAQDGGRTLLKMEELQGQLRQRYGQRTRCAWQEAGPDFQITAAALVGGGSLPAELQVVIGRLTA